MSDKKPFVALFALLIALLAACQSAATDPGAVMPTPDATPSPAVVPALGTPLTDDASAIIAAARAHLAAELGIADSEIEVVSAEATEFTDSCLGLGGPAESCLQAITPGWLVVLDAAGRTHELHTDETGQQVRRATAAGSAPADPEAATAAAVAHLARQLGVAETEIEVVTLEAAEFSDSCLGLGRPEESCLQAITPGWLLTLSVGGQEYKVHSDATGGQVRAAE